MTKKTKRQFYIDVGFRLRQARTLKRYSQEKLSDKLGVSAATVQRYETGDIQIPAEALVICSEILETPLHHILGKDMEPRSRPTRQALEMAADVMELPDKELRNSVYQLLRNMNRVCFEASE